MSKPEFGGLGFFWYRREDWDRWMELLEDSDRLSETYEEWLAAAEDGVRQYETKGYQVHRVVVEPDAFLSWCDEHGMPPNGQARTRYAAEAVRDIHEEGTEPKGNGSGKGSNGR